jgi:hypothetical protein
MGLDVFEDSVSQLRDAGVRAALERMLGEKTKEPFNEVYPR